MSATAEQTVQTDHNAVASASPTTSASSALRIRAEIAPRWVGVDTASLQRNIDAAESLLAIERRCLARAIKAGFLAAASNHRKQIARIEGRQRDNRHLMAQVLEAQA